LFTQVRDGGERGRFQSVSRRTVARAWIFPCFSCRERDNADLGALLAPVRGAKRRERRRGRAIGPDKSRPFRSSVAHDNMRNLKLVIAYDGTNFRGWQRQPHGPTVQGTLESALAKMT